MSSVPNPRVTLARVPGDGAPIVGEHLVYTDTQTIDVNNVPLGGGFLTKLLQISPEPYMRQRMRDSNIRSYSTPMVIGAPVVGSCLVKVIRSEKKGVKAEDLMYGMSHWELYTVQPYIEGRNTGDYSWAPGTFDMDSLSLQVVPDPQGAFPLSRYCSMLGTPGLSGWTSFEAFSHAKEGETCYVSAGASGVGSMVVQLAKSKGMKVIASAGSNIKVDYIKSLGADFAFNYRKTSYTAALSEFGPLDLFYDNVGGEALEAAIENMSINGRIIICGAISDIGIPYKQRHGVKNLSLFLERRLRMHGFLVADLISEFGERFFAEVPALLSQGKLKSTETLIYGIENAAQAFVDMLKGNGKDALGKPVVIVSEP